MSPPAPAGRTLPLRVAVAAGESLDSWLEAVAGRNGLTMRQFLPAVGLAAPRTPRGLLAGLAPELLRRIEGQAGLPTGRLDAAVLDRYLPLGLAGDHPRHLPPNRWKRWARTSGARFCPPCLAESQGRWQLGWYLSWSFACTTHQALLATACPHCGRPPRAGENRWDHTPAPTRCAHPAPGTPGRGRRPRCNAALTEAGTARLDPGHPALEAQRWVEDALGLGGQAHIPDTVALLGLPVPLGAALDGIATAMRQAATGLPALAGHRTRHLAPGRRAGEGLPTRQPGPHAPVPELPPTLDEDPASFATAAALALDALTAPTLDHAVAAAGWLLHDHHGRARATPGGETEQQAQEWPLVTADAPLCDALLLRHRAPAMRIGARLSFRTANPLPRQPLHSHHDPAYTPPAADTWPYPAGRLPALPARLVPQCIWPSVAATLPQPTCEDTPAFPAAMAMALVRAGTFLSWRQIAFHLALPHHLAPATRAAWAQIAGAGHTTAVLTTLDQLLETLLGAPPPIDYARRRRVFRDLPLLGGRRFHRACRQHGLTASEQRRRHATMRLWEQLTGGDTRLHPGHLASRDPADRSAYTAFRTGEAHLLDDYLLDEAERHLLRHHLDEPITWQPDTEPTGPTWRSPPPDLTRRLPGRPSPSHPPPPHTGQAWQHLTGDAHLRDLATCLVAFSPRHAEQAGLMWDGNETNRLSHHYTGREWPLLAGVHHLQRRFGVRLLDRDPDGDHHLTPDGQRILDDLVHTLQPMIIDHGDDPWQDTSTTP